MSCKSQDTTDRQRLELALQAAGLGDFQWDLEGLTVAVSARMSAITGLTAGVTPLRGDRFLARHIHLDDVEAFNAQRQAGLASGESFDIRFRFLRPDDERMIWLRLAGVVSRHPDGRAHLVTGIVEDISAAQALEAQRIQLIAEMDHRVKNVLSGVQALAQQTARRTTSLGAFLVAFNGRIKAMGSANELLTAARWRGAAIDHLATAVLGALAPGQTSWQGPELFLTPRAADALSLALHELATNAARHGALSQDAGHVDLRWRAKAEGGFEVTWTESGGPAVAPPTRLGFGSTLLQQVTGRELQGEVTMEFRPPGLRVRIEGGAGALVDRPETLPEAPVARPAEPAIATTGGHLRGVRVLIVEDAVLLALELETGLTEAGAVVVGPAYDLSEAAELLDQPIDAAILDVNLNGQSVMPLAQQLTEQRIPFIFATGYDETGSPAGFDAPVIRKPYDVTQVAAALVQLLAP